MNQSDLLNKWKHKISSGFYGFDGLPEEWCHIIDFALTRIDKQDSDFEIQQIKVKFGGCRFYITGKESSLKIADIVETLLFDGSLIY